MINFARKCRNWYFTNKVKGSLFHKTMLFIIFGMHCIFLGLSGLCCTVCTDWRFASSVTPDQSKQDGIWTDVSPMGWFGLGGCEPNAQTEHHRQCSQWTVLCSSDQTKFRYCWKVCTMCIEHTAKKGRLQTHKAVKTFEKVEHVMMSPIHSFDLEQCSIVHCTLYTCTVHYTVYIVHCCTL